MNEKFDFIDAVMNQIKTKARNSVMRKLVMDFILAKEGDILIAYRNFFEKKNITIDTIIGVFEKKATAPPSLYDFLTTMLGDFLNVKIALICGVGIFTNVPKLLQDEISDRDFIIVIMSGGRMYVLDGEISDEVLLGVSPLSKYFTEKHLTTLIKCHTQGDHSDPSTESEQPPLGEHSDPSTESEQPPLGEHSDPSTESEQPPLGDHSDPSTESEQPPLGETRPLRPVH